MSKPVEPPEAPPNRGERLWAYILALLSIPLVVLWRQDDTLFTRRGFIDPWFYVGYAKNLLEFKRYAAPGYYPGSRLAWILPCTAVHALLPPVAAAYVLHLAVWMLGVLSLFFALRGIVGVRAAFLTALLMGTHSWFWYAVGWDYPDGAAMGWVLLATALFIHAAQSPVRRGALFAAGLAVAAALHSTLGWLGLSPLLPLPYIFLAREWGKRALWRSFFDVALWTGAGAILLTAALGLVNVRLDGSFWFFLPSLRQGQMLAGEGFRWLDGVWEANGLQPWLWLPAAMACVSVVILARRLMRGRGGAGSAPVVFAVQCLAALAYLAYFQSTGVHGFSYFYDASFAMPFLFLTIGGAFWKGIDTLSARSWVTLCILAACIFAFFWYEYAGAVLPPMSPRVLFAAIAGGLLLAGMQVRDPKAACTLAISGFAVLTMESRFTQEPQPHVVRQTYSQIMQSRERLDSERNRRPIRFWYDPKDPNSPAFLSLASSYLQGSSFQDAVFPAFPCTPASKSNTAPLVALSSRPDSQELAQRAIAGCLADEGMLVHTERLGSFTHDGQVATATLVTVATDPAIWHAMKLVSDGGAMPLADAEQPEPISLPVNGWSPVSSGADGKVTRDGLLVHPPEDDFGVNFQYRPVKIVQAGRYRFVFQHRLNASVVAVGVRYPGAASWKGSGGSRDPSAPLDQTAITCDLNAGDRVEFVLSCVRARQGGPPASVLLRGVTVQRRDLH
ncbi:MAG TPA: hypothetical protein VML19_07440 [Verrucomicrobiae bacterium]|nr:hypothetical protein [Verrucomicrobiae bacterium]